MKEYLFITNVMVCGIGFYCHYYELQVRALTKNILQVQSESIESKTHVSQVELKHDYQSIVYFYLLLFLLLFVYMTLSKDLGLLKLDDTQRELFFDGKKAGMIDLIRYFSEEISLFLMSIFLLFSKLLLLPPDRDINRFVLSHQKLGIYLLLALLFLYLSF